MSSIINKIEKSEIRKCIYDPVEKKDLLESLLNRIVDVPLESNKDISEVSTNFILEVINISSHIKDESFKDEGEYRLIYFGGPNETKFHEGRSMIIPYIEFSPVDDSDLLPISKIIVGPTPHPELSKLSIKTLLKSKKYNIEVEQSDIPYRSW